MIDDDPSDNNADRLSSVQPSVPSAKSKREKGRE
jgi:hypothetical protein